MPDRRQGGAARTRGRPLLMTVGRRIVIIWRHDVRRVKPHFCGSMFLPHGTQWFTAGPGCRLDRTSTYHRDLADAVGAVPGLSHNCIALEADACCIVSHRVSNGLVFARVSCLNRPIKLKGDGASFALSWAGLVRRSPIGRNEIRRLALWLQWKAVFR
jgi:hypothetical protein